MTYYSTGHSYGFDGICIKLWAVGRNLYFPMYILMGLLYTIEFKKLESQPSTFDKLGSTLDSSCLFHVQKTHDVFVRGWGILDCEFIIVNDENMRSIFLKIISLPSPGHSGSFTRGNSIIGRNPVGHTQGHGVKDIFVCEWAYC